MKPMNVPTKKRTTVWSLKASSLRAALSRDSSAWASFSSRVDQPGLPYPVGDQVQLGRARWRQAREPVPELAAQVSEMSLASIVGDPSAVDKCPEGDIGHSSHRSRHETAQSSDCRVRNLWAMVINQIVMRPPHAFCEGSVLAIQHRGKGVERRCNGLTEFRVHQIFRQEPDPRLEAPYGLAIRQWSARMCVQKPYRTHRAV